MQSADIPIIETTPNDEGRSITLICEARMFNLKSVRFHGTLGDDTHSVNITFNLEIDQDGILQVRIERVRASLDAFQLYKIGRPGERVAFLNLTGVSDNEWACHSRHFQLTGFSNSFKEGQEIEIQGYCTTAELTRPTRNAAERSSLRWYVRQFGAVHALKWSGPLGDVLAGGPPDLPAQSQQPAGAIIITHPTGEADDNWWRESNRFISHIARVLSFGCDHYFLPVIEQHIQRDRMILRVVRRRRSESSSLPLFTAVYMEPLFDCACESFASHSAEVEALDPAIRWLTSPAVFREIRLLNAMTALECIVDRTAPKSLRHLMTSNKFKKLGKDIKEFLQLRVAPADMLTKLPELNRRPLRDQIQALLELRNIYVGDLPSGWIETTIAVRNAIVHTGVPALTDPDTSFRFEHVVWVREVVTRLIFERIGFVGPYCSWLHNHGLLHFPECERLDRWAARQATSSISA